MRGIEERGKEDAWSVPKADQSNPENRNPSFARRHGEPGRATKYNLQDTEALLKLWRGLLQGAVALWEIQLAFLVNSHLPPALDTLSLGHIESRREGFDQG